MALKKKNLQTGVTLVEMLVVVAIIALVSSVLLFNYSDFTTNVSVRNLSQEVALSVRKAQTYATSVRTLDGTTLDSKTFPGYGISFAVSDDPADLMPPNIETPGPRQFILFADTSLSPEQPSYDAGSDCGNPTNGDECLESISINTADKITSICNGANTGNACYAKARADITFRRPSPDATICLTVSGATDCNVSYVTLNLQSAKGLQRSIQVWNTGQISVQ